MASQMSMGSKQFSMLKEWEKALQIDGVETSKGDRV